VIADDEVNGPASTGKGSSGFTFLGSVGSDFVYATGSTDNLSGNAGNDFLVGYAGNDTVDGGDGDDVLFGDDLGPSGDGPTILPRNRQRRADGWRRQRRADRWQQRHRGWWAACWATTSPVVRATMPSCSTWKPSRTV
jgi:hypothetical protein